MPDPDRPNVLFVLTDQQRANMMRCAGNPHLDTPAMDRIAERGVRFERAYCANPECSPSRTALLTGRFPSTVDQRSNRDAHIGQISDGIAERGLGNRLRGAGYEAAYAGKDHLPTDLSIERLGFDYLTTDRRDGCADACVDFLESDSESPFFLAASLINPHDICYMAIRDARENDPDYEGFENETAEAELDAALERPPGIDEETFFAEHAPPLPANHERQADEPEAVRKHIDERSFKRYARTEWSAERWREHRWAYARLTERVDRQVGRILDALRESGQREDTVVILASDHGDMDAAHRLEHKELLYEEAVRVPFLVSDPAGPSGQVNDRLVSLLDILPTVCDYAGAAASDRCAGRSVRPLISGTDVDWRSHLRIESRSGEALVTDRYKYALYDDGADREQLYDLGADPGETTNYASDPENARLLDELRDCLLEDSQFDRGNDVVPS
jgi:choline-sulfatase